MDNAKVNGLNPPSEAHTVASPPRAPEAATHRFSQAMREAPPSLAAATTDTSRAGTGWVGGSAAPGLTREGRQEDRDFAYRRLQDPMSARATSSAMRDVSADSSSGKSRTHVDPTEVALSNSAWSPFSLAIQARAVPAPRTAAGAELTQMLERMCSALYVGEKSPGSQRLVMVLDHVLPGAAAEIVREGVHLSIRLHARTEASFRSMSAERDALVRALSGEGDRRVDVSVVHGNHDKTFGDGPLGDVHG